MGKKGQATIDRTVALVLAVLLILVIIGILVYLNLPSIYKLLPNYNSPSESGDEVINDADVLAKTSCGDLKTVGYLLPQGYISILNDDGKTYSQTILKYTPSGRGAELSVNKDKLYNDILFHKFDFQVGSVENAKASILKNYLDENDIVYLNYLFGDNSFSVTAKQLSYIDGSFYKANFFCKPQNNLISSGYVVAWPYTLDKDGNVVGAENVIDLSSNNLIVKYNGKSTIVFEPFVNPSLNSKDISKINYYFVKADSSNDYISIHVQRDWASDCRVGYIAKDGFVYFGSRNVFDLNSCNGAVQDNLRRGTSTSLFSEEVQTFAVGPDSDFSLKAVEGFVKTNIKIDYYKTLKEIIKIN